MSSAGSRRGRGGATGLDGGQAAVELALVLPVLALLLLVVVQVGLVVRDGVLVVHAAREVARELAVREIKGKPPQATAREVAVKATGGALEPDRLAVEVTESDGRVHARVGYRARVWVPLLGIVVRDVPIAANAEARSEID